MERALQRTGPSLRRHVLFRTTVIDGAHERVGALSLDSISYGGDVAIDLDELTHFHLVQIPLAGAATIRNGRCKFASDQSVGAVLNADLPTRMS